MVGGGRRWWRLHQYLHSAMCQSSRLAIELTYIIINIITITFLSDDDAAGSIEKNKCSELR